MSKKEEDYLDKIFKAIPLMSDFEKGRLYGAAEELLRQKEKKAENMSSPSSSRTDDAPNE